VFSGYYRLQHKSVYICTYSFTYLLNIDIDIDIAVFRHYHVCIVPKLKSDIKASLLCMRHYRIS